jgi:hypothetical protein
LHGGIIFLQCGRPTVLVHNDLRVTELAEFHAIPATSSLEVLENSPIELLREKTNDAHQKRFRESYTNRLATFHGTLRKLGLQFCNEDAIAEVLKPDSIGWAAGAVIGTEDVPQRGRGRSPFRSSPDDHRVQISHSTKPDRYPRVFQICAELVRNAGFVPPKVLSYGCSTGEEAYTLATKYFPDGEIVGLDVSAEAIERARETYPNLPRVRFDISDENALKSAQQFSIVFAMSVLCRWPESRSLENIKDIFPFSLFERQVQLLDNVVQDGGFLVIYNASYGFLQTKIASKYDLVLHPAIKDSGFVKRFQKDGRFVAGLPPTDCIYRKRAGDDPETTSLVLRDIRLRTLGSLERP